MGLVLAEVAEVAGAHVIVFFAIFLEVLQQNKKKQWGKKWREITQYKRLKAVIP